VPPALQVSGAGFTAGLGGRREARDSDGVRIVTRTEGDSEAAVDAHGCRAERERARERGRERGREGGMEGERKGWRDGGREGWRERGRRRRPQLPQRVAALFLSLSL
jgi:hypothetical protein